MNRQQGKQPVSETITLQIGRCSNYAGTHFWNSNAKKIDVDQEEAENDTTFSSSTGFVDYNTRSYYHESRDGKQCFPRCINIDLSENISAYEEFERQEQSMQHQSIFWTGNVQTAVHTQMNSHQKGEFWSDLIEVSIDAPLTHLLID